MTDEQPTLPSRTIGEEIIESPKTHNVLDKEFVANMRTATPSVKNLRIFKGSNTGPVTVTQFKDGQEGQIIKILGDGQMTITNGANIKTNTGANKLLAANKVYTFTRISNVWYENE
jgi:hypothetical protein